MSSRYRRPDSFTSGVISFARTRGWIVPVDRHAHPADADLPAVARLAGVVDGAGVRELQPVGQVGRPGLAGVLDEPVHPPGQLVPEQRAPRGGCPPARRPAPRSSRPGRHARRRPGFPGVGRLVPARLGVGLPLLQSLLVLPPRATSYSSSNSSSMSSSDVLDDPERRRLLRPRRGRRLRVNRQHGSRHPFLGLTRWVEPTAAGRGGQGVEAGMAGSQPIASAAPRPASRIDGGQVSVTGTAGTGVGRFSPAPSDASDTSYTSDTSDGSDFCSPASPSPGRAVPRA